MQILPQITPEAPMPLNTQDQDYRESCDRALADLIAKRRELGLPEDPWVPSVVAQPLSVLEMERTKLAQIIIMPLRPSRAAQDDTAALQIGLQRLVSRYSLEGVQDALRKLLAAEDSGDCY